MKVSQKIRIIWDVASFFQSAYTYDQIKKILANFQLPDNGPYNWYNSKRLYVEHRLTGVSDNVLQAIIDDFDISIENIIMSPPKNWENTLNIRVFISHLSNDKNKATRLKEVLEEYNIDAFVAHEDIEPTKEETLIKKGKRGE